jgi:antitoxin MazE
VKLAKWGNSLAVRIPAGHAQEIGLAENGEAEMSVHEGKLVLAPAETIPVFDLDALVAQITDSNRHDEVNTGPAVGPEFR